MYSVGVREEKAEKGGREGRGLRAVNYNAKPAKRERVYSTKSATVGNMIQEF